VAAKLFGWTGTTRRQAVVTKAASVFQAWWNAWAIEPTTVQATDGAEASGTGSYVCFEAQGRFALHVAGDLAAVLTGIRDDQGGELAEELHRAAMADLTCRLAGAEFRKDPATTKASTLADELVEPRWGACSVTMDCAGVQLLLWLDRDVAARWAPISAGKPIEVTKRVEAIAPARVRLSTSLNLGEITLEELHGLMPGDVIATQAPLTRPFDIAVASRGEQLFRGQLGQKGGHRAMRLLAVETLESV